MQITLFLNRAYAAHFIRLLVRILQRFLFTLAYLYATYYEISLFFSIYYSNDIFEACFIAKFNLLYLKFTHGFIVTVLRSARRLFRKTVLLDNHGKR